ncbi:MAG TPA: hypothetical protein VGK29_02310 [Paludibaculum sp.]|jgi:hypothetical protein
MSPSRIVRYEFLGSWLLFWLLCITMVGLPVALLYLLHGTVRIDEEIEDPSRFISEFRAGRLGG